VITAVIVHGTLFRFVNRLPEDARDFAAMAPNKLDNPGRVNALGELALK